jgi:hypothetical protein
MMQNIKMYTIPYIIYNIFLYFASVSLKKKKREKKKKKRKKRRREEPWSPSLLPPPSPLPLTLPLYFRCSFC